MTASDIFGAEMSRHLYEASSIQPVTIRTLEIIQDVEEGASVAVIDQFAHRAELSVLEIRIVTLGKVVVSERTARKKFVEDDRTKRWTGSHLKSALWGLFVDIRKMLRVDLGMT